jgi:uncharacterized protein YdgA (DUF945 family)
LSDRNRRGGGLRARLRAARGASRPVLIIVMVLALVLVFLPWLVGYQTEKTYRQQIQQFAAQGTPFNVESFERGWFSSTATTALDWQGHHFTVHQQFTHGPLPLGSGRLSPVPVASVIDSTVEFPPEFKDAIQHFFGDKEPLTIRTVVGFSGTLSTEVHVPAFAGEDPATDINAASDGFDGEFDVNAGSSLSAKWNLSSLRINSGGRTLLVSGFSSDDQWHRDASGVWIGNSNVQLASLEADGPPAAPPFKLLAKAAAFSAAANLRDSGLEIESNLTADSGGFHSIEAEKIHFANEVDNIDPAALLQLRDALAALSAFTGTPAARSELARQKLVQPIVALAKHAPALSLDLEATTPHGPATANVKVAIKNDFGDAAMLVNPDLDMGMLANALMGHSTAAVNLRLPAPLPTDLVPDQLQQQAVMMGFVTKDGSDYVTQADWNSGSLTVNKRRMF